MKVSTSPNSPDDDRRAVEIFLNAPPNASKEELDFYLDEACAGDEELRARVDAMLAQDLATNGLVGSNNRIEEVTRILEAIEGGDTQAAEQLLPLVYDELRRIAANKMKAERAGHTLQPTALVHEAYLRLLKPDGSQPRWNSRGHFFVAVAEAMRRILIESIRRKQALKRGGDLVRTTWDEAEFETEVPPDNILAVHEALESLEKSHPGLAKTVLMRYFAGMTIEETAAALDTSESSIGRQWRAARAWLQREIVLP